MAKVSELVASLDWNREGAVRVDAAVAALRNPGGDQTPESPPVIVRALCASGEEPPEDFLGYPRAELREVFEDPRDVR